MRLKQLAVAVLCSGAFIAPALAQTTTAPKPMTAPAATAPMVPSTPGQAPAVPATPAPMAAMPPAAAPVTGLTNINTATVADLDKLPQIGKARAGKIIQGRPYKTTDDLLTKKVLSKGVYNKIKDKITT